MNQQVPISSLIPGENIIAFYLVKQVKRKVAKNGNPYIFVELGDRFGAIDGRKFGMEPAEVEGLAPGVIVKVAASVDEFNDKTNLNISKIRVATEAEALQHQGALVRSSAEAPEVILSKIREELIEPLKEAFRFEYLLLDWMLRGVSESQLLQAPAASRLHHAYIGGLLEHILSLGRMSIWASFHYSLDRGTMTALAMLHDWGKLLELANTNGAIEYTRAGHLFGHIAMGYATTGLWVQSVTPKALEAGVDPVAIQQRTEAILHGILSHHGELEHGSPVRPATREAIAFHFIDNLDSRMAMEAEAWEREAADSDITAERHWSLGVRLLRFKK